MSELSPEQTARVIALAMDLARAGDTAQLVEFLDHGLPVDTTDGDGQSLLMMTAYHGNLETVRALVARGANVNLLNAREQSPLAGALFKGEDAVARALVDAGADVDLGTPTAREAAEMFGRDHLLS